MIGRNALRQFSWRKTAIRIYSTQTAEATPQKVEVEWNDAKSYKEIPGPGIFELVTGFLPFGKYHGKQIIDMHQAWQNTYGDIVRIPGLLGRSDTILTYDPLMVEKVFRTEGPMPVRRGLETFNYYRKKMRPEIFGDVGGLLSEDGEKWLNIRSKANPVMLQPKTVKMYIEKTDQVAQEFITKIRQMRDKESLEMRDKFGHELNRWALESIGVIALDERLGALWDSGTSEEGEQVIELVKEFFVLSYELDVSTSVWKYYKTPQFKRLMWVFDQMTEKIMKRVDNAVARLEALKEANVSVNTSDRSVLEKLLLIDRRIAVVMAFDMLLAGIDTTSTALVSCLYHLATNPEKQKILREEVINCLPTHESQLTNDSLNNMPYMRACLKEALRISPVLAGNARQTGKDVVISGYQVPKGVEVAMCTSAMQMNESYFPKSKEFIPERWIKNNKNCEYALTKGTNSFVYLPFGFGPRSCIGRRFAEMEVFVLLSRIIREFQVEYHYGPLQYKTSLIQSPGEDLKFKLIDVDE